MITWKRGPFKWKVSQTPLEKIEMTVKEREMRFGSIYNIKEVIAVLMVDLFLLWMSATLKK